MSKLEIDPLSQFLYALLSPMTKLRYTKNLEKFFQFVGINGTLEDMAKSFVIEAKERGDSWVFANMMNYMTFQKERVERSEIAAASIKNYYKPIKLFLEMNDINLSWKKISRGLPRGRRYANDRSPTIEEIRKLVEYPDRRIKAIVCTMCSSGIRVGAWDYLRWKDVIPIKRNDLIVAAKLIVYAEDEDQYFSYITPEAYHELKKWMDYRKSYGEPVSDNSWLMRDLWDVQKFSRGFITFPKKLKASGVKRLIERALKAQCIRGKLELGKRRYEFQTNHGFRKFFKTGAEQKMKPINVEILMDHSTGISDSYYRPTDDVLLDDYLKAIPNLTVSEEEKLRLEYQKLEKKHIEETNKRLDNLEKRMEKSNKNWQLEHDFNSVEYETDMKRRAEKHLKFCKKYNLDPMKKYTLTATMSEEGKKKLQAYLKLMKWPEDL